MCACIYIGADRMYEHIEEMIGKKINHCWKFCWKFISPALIVVSAISVLLISINEDHDVCDRSVFERSVSEFRLLHKKC
jgi:Sodium:neurotransmitter symporter family